MGKIVQLQNKKTGENEYPRTYTKAIIDDQATPLDTLMQNQNDKIAELGSEAGVFEPQKGCWNIDTNSWGGLPESVHYMIPLNGSKNVVIKRNSNSGAVWVQFAFLKNYSYSGNIFDLADGCEREQVTSSSDIVRTVPSDAKYLYVVSRTNGIDVTPEYVLLDGYSVLENPIKNNMSVIKMTQDLSHDISAKSGDVIIASRKSITGTETNTIYLVENYTANFKEGDKLRIVFVGLGVAASEYAYYLDGVRYDTVNSEENIVLDKDVKTISIAVRSSRIIGGGDLSVSVAYNGLRQAINDLEKENKKQDEKQDEKFKGMFVNGNLINPDEFIDNTAIQATGEESTNVNYYTSPFVEIEPSACKRIYFSHKVLRTCLYDSNKVFLSYKGNRPYVDIVDNARYIRFSVSKEVLPFDERNQFLANPDYMESNKYFTIDTRKISVLPSGYARIDDLIPYYTSSKEKLFTNSFSFKLKRGDESFMPMIFSCMAKYVQIEGVTDVPTIQFGYEYERNVTAVLYKSMVYTIGGKNQYERKEWRIPPYPTHLQYLTVNVVIPEGVSLYISDIGNRFEMGNTRTDIVPRLNCHNGCGAAPWNTLLGFSTAAVMGYPCCICVPKITSDGVWVCFHDDDNIGSRMCNLDGSSMSVADSVKSVSQFTYAQLQGLRYKDSYVDEIYDVSHGIPTLEDFLNICAKTGMNPMFSVHPIPSFDEMQDLKELCKKCGVLDKLHIKSSLNQIASIFEVFGNDVEGYTPDVSTTNGANSFVETMAAINFDRTKLRLGVEFYGDIINEELINKAKEQGYFVAIASSQENTSEYMKYWTNRGVSEWTDDYNNSYGLNW